MKSWSSGVPHDKGVYGYNHSRVIEAHPTALTAHTGVVETHRKIKAAGPGIAGAHQGQLHQPREYLHHQQEHLQYLATDTGSPPIGLEEIFQNFLHVL
jgi:hypothetical protein